MEVVDVCFTFKLAPLPWPEAVNSSFAVIKTSRCWPRETQAQRMTQHIRVSSKTDPLTPLFSYRMSALGSGCFVLSHQIVESSAFVWLFLPKYKNTDNKWQTNSNSIFYISLQRSLVVAKQINYTNNCTLTNIINIINNNMGMHSFIVRKLHKIGFRMP